MTFKVNPIFTRHDNMSLNSEVYCTFSLICEMAYMSERNYIVILYCGHTVDIY